MSLQERLWYRHGVAMPNIVNMIFVTGATGFVGRSVMGQLERAGVEARGHNGRINDPHSLRKQLDGVDTVIHLAGIEGRGRNRQLRHTDLDGTRRLLEECDRAGVTHIVYLSRINADHNSLHMLLKIKGETEQVIRANPIPYTIIRSATLYGRGDRFSEMLAGTMLWGWPFVWLPGGGKSVMQPLWVEDGARCLITAVQQPRLFNKTVTIAGEEMLRAFEIMDLLLRVLGIRRISMSMPMVLVRPLSNVLFSWWRWPPFTRYAVDRLFVPETAVSDSVTSQFNFRPARMRNSISYLRRSGMRRRFFKRHG